MTTPTPMHDELVDALHELVAFHPWLHAVGSGPGFDVLARARTILTRTPLGSPTGNECRATNNGQPNYLLCGQPLYRYAVPKGQIDQCGSGHMSEVSDG